MVKILIADDHPILRGGLKEILVREFAPGGLMVGEAEDGQRVLDEIQRTDWNLLILDLTMPGRDGLEVLKSVKAVRPRLPVLVLSMHTEDPYGKWVLRAGGAGYMNKETAAEALIGAVRRILGGGRYVSPALAETLASGLREDGAQPAHHSLSAREFAVLLKLATGRRLGQIAEELNLTVPTIRTHRARILEKLGMSTTAELILYAVRNHLVD